MYIHIYMYIYNIYIYIYIYMNTRVMSNIEMSWLKDFIGVVCFCSVAEEGSLGDP